MNKAEAYSKLFELRSQGVNVSNYIRELCKSEEVPTSVEKFLENQTSNFKELNTLLSEKLCYKSIQSDDYNEKLVGASSIITHLIIESTKNPEKSKAIYDTYNIEEVLEGIRSHFNGEHKDFSEILNKIVKEVSNR